MRQIWTGCILLLTAWSSSAVTLGRHSGGAILGQPLDIRVQVLLAPGEDVANQCLSADVLYGDVQLPGSLVRLTPQKAVADAQASVRIQSPQAINEPIVTVFVRAGCSTAFTRRFVLLADPLTEPAPSASGSSPVVVPALPSVESPSAAAPTRGAGGSVRSNNASAPAVRSAPRERQATTAPAAPRVPSVVRRSSPPVPKAATPRLQLDPIDLSLTVDRDPTLKLSPLLLSEPAASPEARAAAGQLWKALSASPEQALQDGGKLAALEAEVAQLRSAQTQAQTRLDALNAEVEQARDQRYRNWLVYLLGGLLLVALLALLMLSRRRPAREEGSNASPAWWSPHEAQRADKAAPPTVGAVAGPRKGPGPAPGKAAGHRRDLDQDSGPDSLSGLDDDGPSEPVRTDAPVPAQATRERRDFSPSALGISRSVAAEELFDVQQQADFFVSLGEDDRAIQVLRSHIAESHEPSPLAYLDLFKLYHRLDRREAYDALRDEFNHVFNAGAPPFHRYTAQGQGLEAYESAFSRIQSLWPQPRVLDLIERSIFRDANDDQVEVFDLEAYRELLLLHAIAKDLIQRDGVALADHADFSHTNMRPLKADGRHGDDVREGRRTEPMPLDRMHPVSSHLGLDIDLDALEALQASSEISAFEASLPEVNAPVRAATEHGRGDRPHGDGHLMDFEIVDFMPPDEDPPVDPNGRDGARKNRS